MNNHICKAKSLGTGEWVQGYYVQKTDPLLGITYAYLVNQGHDEWTKTQLSSFVTWYQVDSDTVCRYTGVNDRNGKPIFEHDILRGTYYHMFIEHDATFEVHWDKQCGGFGLNHFEPIECDIIGNKFDTEE